MRTLKSAGIAELKALRSRARKVFGMERISRPDFEYIDRRLDEVEARIVSMREMNERGEEEGLD